MWVKGLVTSVVILVCVGITTAGQDNRSGKELKAREIFITPIHDSSLDGAAKRASTPNPDPSGEGMALRYALWQGIPNSCVDLPSYRTVDPDTSFRTGDCVRLSFEVNAPGYFYVLTRGSSGQFSALPVSARSGDIESRIEPCQTYEFPADTGIRFSDPAGEERLFLVLAREPVAAFRSGNQRDIAQALGMANDDPPGMRSRDIVIEKVAANTPPVAPQTTAPVRTTPKECGSLSTRSLMYVAASRSDLRRVVADIRLVHR